MIRANGVAGIVLEKYGPGTATINLKAFQSVLGGHDNGRLVISEGDAILKGGGWYVNPGDVLVELKEGCSASTSSAVHALGGPESGVRYLLQPGSRFHFTKEQYFSENGDAAPNFELKGNAVVTAGSNFRPSANPFVIKASGAGNRFEGSFGNYSSNRRFEVAAGGELFFTSALPQGTTTVKGGGTVVVENWQSDASAGSWIIQENTALSLADTCTSLPLSNLTLNDGCRVTTGTQPVALPGAIIAYEGEGTATISGVWASTPDADFSAGLVLPAGNTFVLNAQNMNGNFTGLDLQGTLRVDAPTLSQIPATLDLSNVTAIEVTGSILPGDIVFKAGVTELPANLPTITASSGATGTWTIVDGALVLQVADAPDATAQNLTWTPSTIDAEWDSSTANWTNGEGASQVVWMDGNQASFTGTEANYHESIDIPETVAPSRTSFSGDKDYTLTGTGTLAGGRVVKSGSGTLTVDGAGFGDQAIVVEGGTLKVGDNAGETALGTHAGALIVKDGGKLDVNYCSETANDSTDEAKARHNITHRKTIMLENGATLENNNKTTYGTFGEVFVSGTVTLGGTARMDWRNFGTDPDYNQRPVLRGDEDSVVQIANSAAVGIVNTDVSVGRIDVLDGGVLRPEGSSVKFTVPNGIHLTDGAKIEYCYDSQIDSAVVFDSGTATANKPSGTGIQRGPLEIKSGATANFAGNGTVSVEGEIICGANINVNAGTFRIADTATSAVPVTIVQSSGTTLDFPGNSSQDGFATLKELNVENNGGNFNIRPQVDGMSDIAMPINVTGTDGILYVYGPNNDHEYGAKALVKGNTGNLCIGLNSSRRGTLELKSGSELTVKNLYLGDAGTSPVAGRLIIDEGAKVTVTSDANGIRVGHWSGEPSVPVDHQLIVNGGTLDSSTKKIQVGYDSPGALFEVQDGLVQAQGFESSRAVWLCSPDHQRRFRQTGGTVELGSDGFSMSKYSHGHDWVDFTGGTLKMAKACGTTFGIDFWFGRDEAGEMSVETDSALFNCNVALKGKSAVTLSGSKNFNCPGDGLLNVGLQQGSPLGKWTALSGGTRRLRGARFFAGGLEAAAGANVVVGSCSTNPLPSALCASSATDMLTKVPDGAFSQYTDANDLGYVHTKFSTGLYGKKTLGWIGEFYVEEADAGKWTFAAQYDDNLALSIDGTKVLETTSYTDVDVGTIELSSGWHKFRVCAYDSTGGAGPSQAGWGDGKAIGFIKGESTSETSGDYTCFSGENVRIRRPPSVEISHLKENRKDGDWDSMEDYSTTFVTNSIALLSDNTAEELNKGSANRYRGWFMVPTTGDWQFRCNYDDRISIRIDGELVCSTSLYDDVQQGTNYLTTGWHQFEIRCADGTGGYSKNKLSACVMVTPPGGTTADEVAFSETNFEMVAPHLRPDVGTTDLIVAEGATVTNGGTVPFGIYGRLSGTGTLSGNFEFAGGENVWAVTEGEGRDVVTVSFENPSAAMLAGLKKIEFRTVGKPRRAVYRVGPAYGLTAELAAAVEVEATDGADDYSMNFSAAVENGELVLRNARPVGFTLSIQ